MTGSTPAGSGPRLSVVLATDAYETIRPVISALRRQRCANDIEPVIVLPTGTREGILDKELTPFARVQVVPVQAVSSLARARAAGVRAATAPIVFIGETHSYPQPGWAEALLARFEESWTAAVPGIDNANPTGAISWASYLVDYGSWGTNRPAGEMPDPLIYNTAFRRAALLSLGDALDEALDPNEETLWPRLWAAGHRAVFAPDARILHVNATNVKLLWSLKFSAGVALGMRRAARWPWRRRLLYLIASPLIPVVLLARVARGVRQASPGRLSAGTIPALVLAALAKTVGEVLGYAGANLPSMEAQLVDIEIRKALYAGRG